MQQQSNIQIYPDSLVQVDMETYSLNELTDSLSIIDAEINETVAYFIAEPEIYSNFFHTTFNATLNLSNSSINLGLGQFTIMLIITLMLGFLNLFFSRESAIIVLSPFKTNGIRKLQEEDSLSLNRSMFLMLLIFVFVLSIFVFEIFNYFDVNFSIIPNVPFFIEVFILIGGIVTFRFLISKLLGHVFDLEELATSYNYRLLIINCLTGLILLPFMIGMRLSPESLIPIFAWTGIGVLLVLYTVGLAVGADLSWHSERISKYHLFLYFCTLEIAPFIVLFKALSSLN